MLNIVMASMLAMSALPVTPGWVEKMNNVDGNLSHYGQRDVVIQASVHEYKRDNTFICQILPICIQSQI